MKQTNEFLTGVLTIKRPRIFTLFVIVVFLVLTQLLAFQNYLLHQSAEKEEMAREINAVKDRFQVILKHNLTAAKTLAFIVKKYGVPDDFESVAKAIVDTNKGIDAIQLTRKGVITHVYPLKGNSSVIGYDVLANSTTNKEAEITIQKNELFFAGPLSLKQGGTGIVGRLPIFINGQFYGFAAVITKLETLTSLLGMVSSNDSPFIFQLSKLNPNTQKEEFFLPDSIQLHPDKTLSTIIPDGNWKLYVMQRSEPGTSSFISFSTLGVLFSLVCGLFAWFVLQQPKKLQELVRTKTEQIRTVESANRATLERVSDAVIALDANWRYTYLNDAALAQHPGGREATLGRSLWEIHPELKNSFFSAKYREAMKTMQVMEVEEYYEPLKAWFVVKIYPSENGLTLFYRNITSQKVIEQEALAQRTLSESIINSLPGIFYLYDRNQRFVKWNKNFELVSGYSAEEISKMTALDFFDLDEKTLLQNRIETVFEKGMAEVEAHFLTKDKRKIPFYFNGYLCTINAKDYLIGVGIDITGRRAAELEKEKVTYELVQRYKNMEQFSYIVSHNIRGPVANLMGLTGLLENDLAEHKDLKLILAGISTATNRLDDVIRDLNEILTVRTQVFDKKESFYFYEIVRNVVQSVENILTDETIEITTNFDSFESTNSIRVYIHSIFYNLICNSVKYRRPNVPLKIEITSQKTSTGFKLSFRDNGTGIDLKKYGDSIFGLYKRFHLNCEGKGLGLFMVRTQVESLGGKISVASELNKYTEFTIEFPQET